MEDKEYWEKERRETKTFFDKASSRTIAYLESQIDRHLKTNPKYSLTAKEWGSWYRFVRSNPILLRLLLYTYSPPDETALRDEINLGCNLWQAACYIDFILEDEFKQGSLIRDFLLGLKEDFVRVTAADNKKRHGTEATIEELRKNCLSSSTFKDENGCDTTSFKIDQSPSYHAEIIIKQFSNGKHVVEHHFYPLQMDGSKTTHEIDEYLIQWARLFENLRDLSEDAFFGSDSCFYLHEKDGKIKKIPFALIPKYENKLKKVFKSIKLHETELLPYYDRSVREKDVERRFLELENDVKSKFWELAVKYDPNEHGYFAGYIDARLYSDVRDLRERGFLRLDIKTQKEGVESLDEPVTSPGEGKNRKDSDLRMDFIIGSNLEDVETEITFGEWLQNPINRKIYDLSNEGHTQQEIGTTLGMSQQAVAKRVNKLKKALNKT